MKDLLPHFLPPSLPLLRSRSATDAKFEMTSDADYSACLVSINLQGDAFVQLMCELFCHGN